MIPKFITMLDRILTSGDLQMECTTLVALPTITMGMPEFLEIQDGLGTICSNILVE